MGNHYIRRFDLSKYTLKSFDDSDEICNDKNNSDLLTYNANGVQKVVADTTSSQTLANKSITYATTTPITAHINGGQTLATQLNPGVNIVTVVTSTGDSVKLPLAVQGSQVTVINTSGNAMQVFGAGTDTINNIATATGIAQGAGTTALYYALTSAPGGNWQVQVPAVGGGGAPFVPVALAGDTALSPTTSATYVITKTSAAALTLAPGTDGTWIVVTSNTAFAHTITATLDTGTTSTTSVVFAAHAGASVTLMSWASRWKVISFNTVTYT